MTLPGIAKPALKRLRLIWAWWALVALYLLRLGAAPLFDVDEGAFAEATREMLASGDWGHTFLNGADRFDKPILVYWLQAVAMSLFGVNEFAARLPSALCTLAAAWHVGQFLKPRWGESAAALAVFMGGSALGVLAIGRAATADGLLNALLIMTALRLWEFAQTGDRRALHWAYFWCGLGLLAKGPVAVLVPGGALFWWSIFSDKGRTAWRALWSARGWLVMLTVAAPWYIYALNRHGQAFIDGFILKHNVERFSSAMEDHGGGLAYYLVVWPIVCLPWAPLMLLVIKRARQLWLDPFARFLLLWSIWVMLFFSLAGTKLPHYLLYGTAPMLWLMAKAFVESGRAWFFSVAAATAFAAASIGSSPWFGISGASWLEHPTYQALAADANASWWTTAFLIAALLAMGLAWTRQLWSKDLKVCVGGAAAMALFTLTVLSWWGQVMQGPIKTAGLLLRERGQAATQWRTHQPSVAFYAQSVMPRREPQVGEWALTKASKPQLPESFSVQWQGPDFMLVRKDAP